jgi:hypothetical protein
MASLMFLLVAPTAGTASASSGGLVHVYEDVGTGGSGSIVITGAVTDYGFDQVGVEGKDDYHAISLSKGALVADLTKYDSTIKPSINSKTCSFSYTASGPITLSDGTRAYRGVSGTLNISGVFSGILPRQKNGSCNTNDLGSPLALVGYVHGSGTISF